MKNIKVLIIIMAAVLMLPFISAKADNISPGNVTDLNIHIYKEINQVLQTPVNLKFQDKNISGIAYISLTVREDGKIVIQNINGENNILNDMIKTKIETRNMWTDPIFQGKTFEYKVKCKNCPM